MAQFRYAPLNLKGREKVFTSSLDHLCSMPGCFKYINAGEQMVRWGSYDLHVSCAAKWCDINQIEVAYELA